MVTWKKRQSNFGLQTVGAYLGKYCVGSVALDGAVSRSDVEKYKTVLMLPGLKSTLGNFETIDEAKARVEIAIKHWVANALETEQTAESV